MWKYQTILVLLLAISQTIATPVEDSPQHEESFERSLRQKETEQTVIAQTVETSAAAKPWGYCCIGNGVCQQADGCTASVKECLAACPGVKRPGTPFKQCE
eukprot:m.345738 g.345738  ORF g.345738 m.345738 type:complete len:101 (+) comp27129_c0_seq1:152-454(+)